MAQIRQISGVLSDEPVQELLEGLATELPKEHQRIALSEAALEPIKYRSLWHIIELLLQDGRPDPSSGQNGNDSEERNLRALLDMDLLVIEQCRNDERAKDSSKVGEEARESACADGKVRREPRAHEAVVKVADKEGGEQEQDTLADK